MSYQLAAALLTALGALPAYAWTPAEGGPHWETSEVVVTWSGEHEALSMAEVDAAIAHVLDLWEDGSLCADTPVTFPREGRLPGNPQTPAGSLHIQFEELQAGVLGALSCGPPLGPSGVCEVTLDPAWPFTTNARLAADAASTCVDEEVLERVLARLVGRALGLGPPCPRDTPCDDARSTAALMSAVPSTRCGRCTLQTGSRCPAGRVSATSSKFPVQVVIGSS